MVVIPAEAGIQLSPDENSILIHRLSLSQRQLGPRFREGDEDKSEDDGWGAGMTEGCRDDGTVPG